MGSACVSHICLVLNLHNGECAYYSMTVATACPSR